MYLHFPRITYKGVYIIGQQLYPTLIIPANNDLFLEDTLSLTKVIVLIFAILLHKKNIISILLSISSFFDSSGFNSSFPEIFTND